MEAYKILAISTLLATSATFAQTAEEIEITIKKEKKAMPYWEAHVFAGSSALDADDTLLTVSNIETDKASQYNEGAWKAWTGKIGAGYVQPLFNASRYSDEVQWLTAIEPQLNLYYLKGNVNGDLDLFYQYPGDFGDTKYGIEFESTRLMFDVGLTLASWRNYSIYGIAGIGPAWNTAKLDTEEVMNCPEIDLDGHTSTSFAYEFGGGVNYLVNERVSVSLEYLYTGFNDVKLGEKGTVGNDKPVSDIDSDSFDLNSQAILLGVSIAL